MCYKEGSVMRLGKLLYLGNSVWGGGGEPDEL